MNNKKKQEIPLEAFDNELIHQEIIISDDFKATIEGNKIILTKTENKDERIKNRLIKLIKMSSEVGGFALHKWEADEMLAWLEKQDTERKQLYVRFGDIPSNEKSKIYHGEEEIGDENGVSVYPAFELNGNIVLGLTLPITKTTLYTQQHLLEYDNRPCYLVSGDYVGKGTDGEPLIKNISVIKKLDNYRIKECEKKPAIEMITPEESLGIDSDTYNKIVDECIYGDDKQKSADKVEPKFHEGDWITNGACIIQITSVDDRYYWHDNDCVGGDIESMDKEYHLWSIDDAKDGDALRVNYLTFLFQEVTDNNCQHKNAAVAYCSYVDGDDSFGLSGPDCITNLESIHPATKEQRDLLFEKMHEARYEWDAEKKELEKIDNEEVNGEDYGIDGLWHAKNILEETLGKVDGYQTDDGILEHKCAIAAVNKLYKQKPAEWSEEDKNFMYDTLNNLTELKDRYGDGYGNVGKCIDWLKSLKNRYSWKSSDEQMDALNEKMLKTDEEMLNEEMINEEMLNEEMLKNDEEMLKAAICLIKGVNNDTCHGGFACNGIHKDDVINWLEDLLACY